MDRSTFMAGAPFKYKGHFQRLQRHPLAYDRTYGVVNDTLDTEFKWWELEAVADEGFALYLRQFGPDQHQVQRVRAGEK